ncbi:Ig-like domain-containing protein [Pseudomonas sp.]|uniref:Ig-like domain-containing protein n=1 Tax=Pseudomonas sp. TaxID=306 RepID=UPI0031E09E51
MAVETIGLVAVSENAARKVAVKAGGKIKAHEGTKYLLQVENNDIAPENVTVKREGDDLQITFEGSEKPDLTIQNFFADGMDGQLYGVAEDRQLYAYVRTDGEGFDGHLLVADGESAPISLGGDSLADGSPYLASTFEEAAGFVMWPWLLGLAGVGAAAAAIIHHNNDDGHHHTATSPAPSNSVATDGVGPIQGQLSNGDVTDDAHPALSGNGVPGAIIHIIDNGQEIASTTVSPDGVWSYTAELADGLHNIDVTQELPGEKPSAPLKVIDLVVDTVAPAAPEAWLAPASGSDVKGDDVTSNQTPTIDGKAEPGVDVAVTFSTGEVIHAKADENGDWSLAPTQVLPAGNNEISLIATDPAGNQSETTLLPITIETPASTTPKGGDVTSDVAPNDSAPVIAVSDFAPGDIIHQIDGGTGQDSTPVASAVAEGYGSNASLLDTGSMSTPVGAYVIQSFSYESTGNTAGRIEVTGDQVSSYVTSNPASVTPAAGGDALSMPTEPPAYAAHDSTHIFAGSGLDTLELAGANQGPDLRGLSADNGQVRIEKPDFAGDKALTVSLSDVLSQGESDLFQKGSESKVTVDGDALNGHPDHGSATWQDTGTTTLGSSIFQGHSQLDAEALIKQAVASSIV